MSFYGSTYFQLIDTFYKILVKNKGGVTVDSAPSITEWASQASGRKGILEFGTGNRWVYATQDENNPNAYVFWHAKAGGQNLTKQEFLGGENVVSVPSGVSPIVLTPGSIIKAPQFEYDEAGHIAVSNNVYYQMPISQTESAIADLQEKVGIPADEAGNGVSTGLFLAVDDITDHLNDVENKIDETQTQLGDYQSVFPTTYWNANNSFYEAFGSIEDLRKAFFNDKTSSRTLSDGIVTFKEIAEAGIAGNLAELRLHAAAINGHDESIESLQKSVELLEKANVALDNMDLSLQGQITANKSACDSNLDAEKNRAIAEETRIEGLVTAEASRAKGEESRLEGLINTNQSAHEALEAVVEANKLAVEAAALGISNRVTTLETNSATTVALNEVSQLANGNAQTISSLGEQVKTVDADAKSAAKTLNDRVDLLNGTVTTQGNTLSNKADLQTVTVLEAKVDTHIASAETLFGSKADKAALEDLQSVVSNKADSGVVSDLANTVAQKANQTELNTLSELVATKASQESLNDLAAAVDTKAGLDALEKYMGLVNEQLTKLQEENEGLKDSITKLTARIEVLENPVTE